MFDLLDDWDTVTEGTDHVVNSMDIRGTFKQIVQINWKHDPMPMQEATVTCSFDSCSQVANDVDSFHYACQTRHLFIAKGFKLCCDMKAQLRDKSALLGGWSIENILYQDKSSQNILQTKMILKFHRFHSLKRTT